MKRRRVILSAHDIGERKPVVIALHGDGRITLRVGVYGPALHTSVDRVYYSALRTREMNRVRDRERAARRRLLERGRAAR